MAYEIRVDEVEEIVELRFHGEGDRGEHETSRDKAFEECRRRGIGSLLVDLRDAVMDMSSRELFEFGKSLESARDPRNIRLAVIVREEDSAPSMAAAAAQTRDVQIHVFLGEEAARIWLKS